MNLNLNLEGKKTYIVSIGLIMWAVGGFFAGKVELTTAIEEILIALGLMGLRNGLPKKMQ